MLAKLLRFAAPVVAIALFAMAPPSASASMVDYTTTGTLGPPAVTQLTFVGDLAGSVNAPSVASLGEFHALGALTENYSNVPFTLTITQTVPSVGGPQNVSASLDGTLTANSSDVTLTFAPGAVAHIGLVTYDPDDVTHIAPLSTNLGVTTLQGFITVVPLPATANMGIALLLCLAGAGVWRKLKSGQAIA